MPAQKQQPNNSDDDLEEEEHHTDNNDNINNTNGQENQEEENDNDNEDDDEEEEDDDNEDNEEEEDDDEVDDDKPQQQQPPAAGRVLDPDPSSDDDDHDHDHDHDSSNNNQEFILVRLSDIRKEVQCPICLGIIRKTRTVMECLHRFCRECIDKSMRMGNNECPACRTHCASRRSLRDDPNYDSLISALYPDIDQYEQEELAFQEDERVRNKQIQAAIAQTFRRQTEALTKKRRRSQNTYRRRRNYRSEDDDDANAHDGAKDSSSGDDRATEVKPKRFKRWRGQPSSAAATGDAAAAAAADENDQDLHRDSGLAPPGLVANSEMLAWGKGGMRSNTRYGSASAGNNKHGRSRLAKLGEHLRNLEENDDELDVQVVLVSLDEQRVPVLQRPFLCGRPALSVGQLCQFIALQTSLAAEEVEILAAKGLCSELSSLSPSQVQISSSALNACKDDFQVLDSEETLAGLKAACNFSHGDLMLAYRQKLFV